MFLFYIALIVLPICYSLYHKYWRMSIINPSGKLVVVTGAAQGIGKATVDHLVHQQGAIVIACDINESKLNQEFKGVRNVHTLRVDVTSLDDINVKLVNKIKELQLPVFGIVNNAGIAPLTTSALVYKDEDEMLKVTNVNLLAVQRVVRALYPYMVRLTSEIVSSNEKQFIGGCIVNISSVMGRTILPFAGNYPITKAGVIALSDVLRRELRCKKIRVSCIEPGAIDTSILHLGPLVPDTELTDMADALGKSWTKRIVKSGRLNPPSYIADLVSQCLFSYRNDAYDGIERVIGESYWIEYLIYTLFPLLPTPIADMLLRMVA